MNSINKLGLLVAFGAWFGVSACSESPTRPSSPVVPTGNANTSGSGGGGSTPGGSGASSACSATTHTPNYVTELNLLQTAKISAFPMTASLPAGLDRARPEVRAAIVRGVEWWSRLAGGRIGAVTWISDGNESARLRISMRDLGSSTVGQVVHDFAAGGLSARMSLNYALLEAYPAGTSAAGPRARDFAWEHVAAHEMGHVLGIVGHPQTIANSIMHPTQGQQYLAPTAADVNSILVKYGCR